MSALATIWWEIKRGSVLGFTVLFLFLFAAALAEMIAPYDPADQDITKALKPPVVMEGGSMDHILGTDELG
ncbi:MAG: ABC transporter permease, partial [Desulfobacteraceae bacterium]